MPLTISFAIALQLLLKSLGEIRFTAPQPNCSAKFDRPYIRQQGNRSGPFDCVGEGSLMFGTTAGQSSGNDFTAFGNKVSKLFGILVADLKACIRTEPANFPAMKHSSLSSGFLVFFVGS
jgi:hypothetical protein